MIEFVTQDMDDQSDPNIVGLTIPPSAAPLYVVGVSYDGKQYVSYGIDEAKVHEDAALWLEQQGCASVYPIRFLAFGNGGVS
jgi:hypothetical protein